MKFWKSIGKVQPDLVEKAEEKLSGLFMDLALNPTSAASAGSFMGGDPFIFALIQPAQHVVTMSIPTAATDGRVFYWNPQFIIKKNIIGLRIIAAHEAWHSIFMHPMRRGARNPKLWNVAIDYIVHYMCMDDLKSRNKKPKETFLENVGDFRTLSEYAELLKDPFKYMEYYNPPANIKLPRPDEDRELTEEEKKYLEKREKKKAFFFADPDLPENMRTPEEIYAYLYNLIPKCPECGKFGMYKKPKNKNNQNQKSDGNDKSNKKGNKKSDQGDGNKPDQKSGDGDGDKESNQHNHGGNNPCNCGQPDNQPGNNNGNGNNGDSDQQGNDDGCDHGCSTCGGDDEIDIFGFGETMDEHMDSEESEEELTRRYANAAEYASKMAGRLPAGMEDEIGVLVQPKVSWKDFIRTRLQKAKEGKNRNDWTRFKTRPMFAGLMTPKRRSYETKFVCLLDTSGSMSQDDMSFGLSQLCSLGDGVIGTIVPADAEIYWDEVTNVKNVKPEEIRKTKVVGRGGTMYSQFFDDYEEKLGKFDLVVVVTDGYLIDSDVAAMKKPNVETVWLITSPCQFQAPFGRVFQLNEI